MHYTLKDHQGSLAATVCGITVERLSYDAWGLSRNPVGFGYNNVAHTFDRGYTGIWMISICNITKFLDTAQG